MEPLDQTRANLTRGGKIIPVLDSQDPTNLDSFPALVSLYGPRGVAQKLLCEHWTKTYDSVKEKKERKKLHIHPSPSTIHFYPCNLTLFKQ